ncbi:MAG: OmpA family protein [Verrucomicrobiota bacterium]|jgi:peptidoglycan-associated lipoprotein
MKQTKFFNLLLASVMMVAIGAGCKKTPKNITNIPGQPAPRIGGDSAGSMINPNTSSFGNTIPQNGLGNTSALGSSNAHEIPGSDTMNANEDRSALSQQTVYFDFDRSAIRPSEQPKLEQVATYLKSNPNLQLKIEGHCDDRGTEEYNRALGERRAIAAREFLIQKHNIGSDRITTVSFGEDRPADMGKTEEAYAKNRRDEFVILKP